MRNISTFFKKTILIYTRNGVATAAAGLAYYLSMTVFPIVVIIFALLGNNYDAAMTALEALRSFISENAYDLLLVYILHLSANYSQIMLYAAISIVLFTASAGVRSFHQQMSKMQGYRNLKGIPLFLSSIIVAFLLIAEMVAAILIIVLGGRVINSLLSLFGIVIDVSFIHYLVLFVATVIIMMLFYKFAQRLDRQYGTFKGALFSSLGFVTLSWIFSVFMSANKKFNLIYGSLASIILILLWLFCVCQVIYIGGTINIVHRDIKLERLMRKEDQAENISDSDIERENKEIL